MKSSGDRISDLESRLFRVFSLRFCAFTSQDARHRELPTHGSAQQYWTIKARWIHGHSVSYTYQVSVHTVKSYPIDIAISCGATYWIASKQKTLCRSAPAMHLDSVSAGSTSKCSNTLRVDTSRTVTWFDIPWPNGRGFRDRTLEARTLSSA